MSTSYLSCPSLLPHAAIRKRALAAVLLFPRNCGAWSTVCCCSPLPHRDVYGVAIIMLLLPLLQVA